VIAAVAAVVVAVAVMAVVKDAEVVVYTMATPVVAGATADVVVVAMVASALVTAIKKFLFIQKRGPFGQNCRYLGCPSNENFAQSVHTEYRVKT
jgi:hypothetical protein